MPFVPRFLALGVAAASPCMTSVDNESYLLCSARSCTCGKSMRHRARRGWGLEVATPPPTPPRWEPQNGWPRSPSSPDLQPAVPASAVCPNFHRFRPCRRRRRRPRRQGPRLLGWGLPMHFRHFFNFCQIFQSSLSPPLPHRLDPRKCLCHRRMPPPFPPPGQPPRSQTPPCRLGCRRPVPKELHRLLPGFLPPLAARTSNPCLESPSISSLLATSPSDCRSHNSPISNSAATHLAQLRPHQHHPRSIAPWLMVLSSRTHHLRGE